MWRGATPAATNVGQVDSASVGCAMYLSGCLRIRAPELLALGRRRGRADQHAVTPGAMNLLHDQLVQVREHVVPLLGDIGLEGRHVRQHRLLAQVEADHLRHERIDRLVVGDAGADRVRKRDAAGAIGGEQPGHAELRIGPERARVEEVVVDAPVDHVDALRSARRLHVDGVVADEQILALDQLDAHLLREEAVLEVRGVVRAGGQDCDRRLVAAIRGNRPQVLEQQVGIVLHRPDRLRREQLGKQPHHHLAVLEHVRHAGRHAKVVLEDEELAAVGAHEIDAGDVRVDAAGDVHALHLAAVLRVAEHALGRDHALVQDALLVIDVAEECVQRRDPLLQPALEHGPFVRRNDPRNEIERNQPLGARVLAVDGERDADAVERALRLLALLRDLVRRRPAEPVREIPVMGANGPVRGLHFVVGSVRQGVTGPMGLGPSANRAPARKSLAAHTFTAVWASKFPILHRFRAKKALRACIIVLDETWTNVRSMFDRGRSP